MDTQTLLDSLDTAITIPVIPFKDGRVDYTGHAKNINYLMPIPSPLMELAKGCCENE
jgi:hypothetical protein